MAKSRNLRDLHAEISINSENFWLTKRKSQNAAGRGKQHCYAIQWKKGTFALDYPYPRTAMTDESQVAILPALLNLD